MPLSKKRKAALKREYSKRRLKGWTADFNRDNHGDTDYIPNSDSDDCDCAADDGDSSPAVTTPLELSESEDEDADEDLPKFHCELNPIEMYWGFAKHKFRDQCDGTFPQAKTLVPECLDACPLVTIRRFFRRSWRYADAYRNGLTGKMADFAVKKYTSHRRIGARIMMELDMITR
ncbi:hypothetical protein M407DRAFT_21355 [Tulasnella calospora MUT 4182]|uniref:Uncharacterized protein n=1 Tax=Tulasnella calospora MUT 4182 TaxID=1051891 RepID=A0A0C3M716_9AGAM|nr:hypothetical protein M407DRAFT_21355 [Tulasnella calospora MUT 4182]